MLVNGTNGDDTLFGTRSNEEINGLAGDDFIFDKNITNSSFDAIGGAEDDDLILGGLGDDTLVAGVDNDTLEGGGRVPMSLFPISPIIILVAIQEISSLPSISLTSIPKKAIDSMLVT